MPVCSLITSAQNETVASAHALCLVRGAQFWLSRDLLPMTVTTSILTGLTTASTSCCPRSAIACGVNLFIPRSTLVRLLALRSLVLASLVPVRVCRCL